MVVVVMSFMRMCYVRTCLVGEHVLQLDMFHGKSCVLGDIYNDRFCLKGGMFYSITYFEVVNVLQYTCFVRF